MDFSDLGEKIVVITGATTGIGEATAVEFAKHGSKLVICGRNLDGLIDTKEQCLQKGLQDQDVVIVTGDICEESTLDLIVKTSRDAFGRVDALILNAGKAHPNNGTVLDVDSNEALDFYFNLFVNSQYKLTQKLAAELIRAKGSIIFNSTAAVQEILYPNMTTYLCCKAAADMMSKLFALTFANKGVRVNAVRSGLVKTRFFEKVQISNEEADGWFNFLDSETPLNSCSPTAEEIGRVVVFLASDQSACLTGAVLTADKGLSMTHPAVDWKQF